MTLVKKNEDESLTITEHGDFIFVPMLENKATD
jgi:hypothetical protein